MASRKLAEIAKTIRSKNAGVDKITFDVIFPDRTSYAQVRESGVLSRESVCRMFGIAAAQISDYVEFDPALAIKFTIYRRTPSGSAGDADIFGSQQYGPLLDIEVPGRLKRPERARAACLRRRLWVDCRPPLGFVRATKLRAITAIEESSLQEKVVFRRRR